MELSRRTLVTSGALAAGAAIAASSISAAAADEAAGQAADLVIVGEGMGGLCAGVRAIQNGIANVTIVEVSKWPGGARRSPWAPCTPTAWATPPRRT